MKLLFLVILLSLPSLAYSQEQDHSTQFAIEALNQANTLDYEDSLAFHFTKTFRTPNEQRTVSFDPTQNRPQQWQLISINSKTPSVSQLKDYAKLVVRFQNTQDRAKAEGRADRLLSQIDTNTLRYVETNTDKNSDSPIVFSFRPVVTAENEKFHASLIGSLKILPKCQCLMEVEIHNTAPIKPRFGLTIESLLERYTFKVGEIIGQSILMNVYRTRKGKSLFNQFDNKEFEIYRAIIPANTENISKS